MGQYLGGRKIGTCENMYYMRLEEAEQLAEQGKADDDGILFSDYLKDNQTRWRFSFPDEDGKDIFEDYNKVFTIPAVNVKTSHDVICVHNAHKGGGHGMNIMIPCPHSEEFKNLNGVETSTGGAGPQFLDVKFQAIRDGNIKTVFACSRCGQLMTFGDEEIEKVKKQAIEYFKAYDTTGKNPDYAGGNQALYDYAMRVLERIK